MLFCCSCRYSTVVATVAVAVAAIVPAFFLSNQNRQRKSAGPANGVDVVNANDVLGPCLCCHYTLLL